MSLVRGLAGWLFARGGLGLLARLAVGAMFIWLGVAKLADPVQFMKVVREYDMLPGRPYFLLNFVVALLPWLEVLCGGLLVLGVAVRGNAVLLLLLLGAFTAAVWSRALELQAAGGAALCSIEFDCGCGMGIVNGCAKLTENGILIGLLALVLFSRSRLLCLRPDLFGPGENARSTAKAGEPLVPRR